MMRKLATWADVKAKGEAILETGGVEIIREDSKEVEAYVMSGQVGGEFPVTDGGPYHVILSKRSWENRKNVGGWVQGWLCDCIWGSYFSGEPGRNGHDFGWHGRICSHVYALLLAANLRARKDFFGDRTARVYRAEHIEDRNDYGFDWGIYRLSDGRYAASVGNVYDNELIGRIPMPRGSKESLIATMTRKLSKVAQKCSGSHNGMEHMRKVIDMKSAARPAYNGYRWGVPYSVYRCDPNAPWIGMELDAAVEMGMKPSEYSKVYDGFLPLKGEPSTDSYLDESIMWSIHSDDNAVDVGDCVQIDNNFYYITACNGYNYKYERIPSRMFDPYLMERRAFDDDEIAHFASKKESTRKFTYAEMKELEDEVEDKPWLNNADRLKDPDILGSFM